MLGSRIQAIDRQLNNEKIDIINSSDQSEVLISRALSPAKPLDLYIDDDMSYCIAIFDDDELELAIGRAGVNVNLAANVTNYKIDAFGKKEYERKQVEQETELSTINSVNVDSIKSLNENSIITVSDLLNTSEDSLLEINGIDEVKLEEIYDNVQKFIEENQVNDFNEVSEIDTDTVEEVDLTKKDLTAEKKSVDDKDAENETALEEDVATAEELVSDDESKLETVSKEDAK